jgi:hypothetical protein
MHSRQTINHWATFPTLVKGILNIFSNHVSILLQSSMVLKGRDLTLQCAAHTQIAPWKLAIDEQPTWRLEGCSNDC